MSDLKSPPTRVRWTVLAFVAFASTSAYLTRYCISAANTTIQEDLGFDNAQLGRIMSGFALGYLLCQVPGGWLGNRFGTRWAFAFLSVCWSLCNVWSGAASMLRNLWASRFALGVFQAGLTPISAKILSDWIPLKDRGISSAAIGACMSIGGAFALWMTGWLLAQDVGWRPIFHAYSLVGIVWAVAFYWFFRTKPDDHTGVNESELRLIRDQAQDSPADSSPADDSDPGFSMGLFLSMLNSISMWGLCIQSFFRAAGYVFFVTWFFAFLEYSYGIDKDEAGLLNSLPLIAVVIGSVTGGVLTDLLLRRTGSRWISRSGVAFVALTLCGCFTLGSTFASSATELAAVIAIGALFSGIANPSAWAATIDLGGRQTAVVMGVMNMAGCVAGVALPMILGSWFDELREFGGDWNQVIYLHAAFYFIAAVSWLIVDPNQTLDEPPQAT